jgi:putative inorganic carbon (HCO3(-)) transporter
MSLPEERMVGTEPGFPTAAAAALILLSAPLALATAWRPAELLIALVVVALIVVSLLRVDLAVLLLLALAPLEGAFAASQNTFSPTKVIGVLCLGSFVVNALATRRRVSLNATHVLVLVLVGLVSISATQARETAEATSVTLRYISFAALFFILTQLCVNDHRLQRRIAWVLTVASAVAGLLAIRNFLGGDAYLAALPFINASDTAFFLASVLPLSFWLLSAHVSLRPIVLLSIGLIGAAILLSFSRGALLGVAVGAIWHAFNHRRHLPILFVGALVGLIVAVGFARTNPEQVETGFELKSQVADENVASRLEIWKGAVRLAVTHPIGVGPGNFESYFFEATRRPPSATGSLVVHNTYLDIAAEVGLVAMGLFLAYLVLTFRRLLAARREQLGPPEFASALTTSLVIALVAGFFISEQYSAPFWLIGALAVAIWSERDLLPRPR